MVQGRERVGKVIRVDDGLQVKDIILIIRTIMARSLLLMGGNRYQSLRFCHV